MVPENGRPKGESAMSHPLLMLPLAAIDAGALVRDRSLLDEEAMLELRLSIAAGGLRMPIEVFELAEPLGGHTHGLLSGYRRLGAFRALHQMTGAERYATIPAFVRHPADLAAALAAMVEENTVRVELTPFELGRMAVVARDQGVFPTIEAAVDALHPSASTQKRSRIRALARLADELRGCFDKPEALTQVQAMRLAAAFRAGFGDVIRTALAEASLTDPVSQWQTVLPIVVESERSERSDPSPSRPGRPRRTLRPRHGLTTRRERTRDGYCLHFTGREATSPLMDTVMDEIERIFVPY
jgi:ParB family chromosome partitioning protein